MTFRNISGLYLKYCEIMVELKHILLRTFILIFMGDNFRRACNVPNHLVSTVIVFVEDFLFKDICTGTAIKDIMFLFGNKGRHVYPPL